MSTALSRNLLDPPEFHWDPWDLKVLEDPYPMYEAMRETAPVVWLPKYEVYATGRHDECKQVLSDNSRFMASAGTSYQDNRKPGPMRIPSRLQEVDPPKHTQIRAVLNRILSPLVIRKMRETFLQLADDMAEEVVARGRVDAVDEITIPFIVGAFPAAVGIKVERKEALLIADMRFNQGCPPNELYEKAMKAAQPYLGWYDEACARKNVVPGSVADLMYQAEDAGEFDEGLANNAVRTLVGGGLDSTISSIGHTLHQLARNQDQWALVKEDPKRLRGAFEEAIRVETPFQYTWRTPFYETELSGYRIKRDRKVTVLLGSANRDPRRWENPDRYDISRETVGNYLGFGVGDHICLGQMIARWESDAILNAIVKRVSRMELDGEAEYHLVSQMRNLGSLPLKFTRH